MAVTGKSDFARGQTARKRLMAELASAGMERIDGYFVEDGAMRPGGGVAKVSTNALTLNAGQVPSLIVSAGATRSIVTQDTGGKLRTAPIVGGAWDAAASGLGAVVPAGRRLVRCGANILLPTDAGIKRVEPGYFDTAKQVYSLGIDAPESYDAGAMPTVQVYPGDTGIDFGTAWTNLGAGVSCAEVAEHSRAGTSASTSALFSLNHVAVSTQIGALRIYPALNMTLARALCLWIWVPAEPSDPDKYLCGMVASLWEGWDTGPTNKLDEHYLPRLTQGWNIIVLGRTMLYAYGVEAVSLSTMVDGYWGHADSVFSFNLAGVSWLTAEQLAAFATPPANGTCKRYDARDSGGMYVYCLACKESLATSETRTPWVRSNPSGVTTNAEVVGPTDYAWAIPWASSALTGSGATHFVLYRSDDQGASYRYVGKALLNSYVTDTGTFGDDYDDALNLPQYLSGDDDLARPAKFLAYNSQRVFAAYLDGTRKTAIECSTERKPWAFPTTVDENSDPADGFELDGYAVDGTEFRGWGSWRDHLLAFLDNEFFVVEGRHWYDPMRLVKVDAVGLDDQSCIADCVRFTVWKWNDDFYLYAGAQAQRIGKPFINPDLIDMTEPHDSCCWKGRFVFACVYDGDPMLLIYQLPSETTPGGWTQRTLPSICRALVPDSQAGDLYAMMTGGWLVKLFSGATDWNGSTAADLALSAWSQYWLLDLPSKDKRVKRLLFDVEAATVATLDVTLELLGKIQATFTKTLVVGPTATQYDLEFPMNARGYALKIKVDYTGQTPPDTIYFLGYDVDMQGSK